MQIIVFMSAEGVSVLTPAPSNTLSLLEVGKKDVPGGVPFWIVDVDQLPLDQPTESWVIDEASAGAPHGHGGDK